MKHKNSHVLSIILTLFITLLLLTPVLLGATYKHHKEHQKEFTLQYTITFNEDEFYFDKVLGYDIIRYPDNGYYSDIGKPMLPLKMVMIALPAGIKATHIHINNIQEKTLPGRYTIYPTQSPQTLAAPLKKQIVSFDSEIYLSNHPFPPLYIHLQDQTDLAGQGIATFEIYPIHYYPKTKTICLLKSIEFEIIGCDGYICKDYLPLGSSKDTQNMYRTIIEDIVINPEDVELHTTNNHQILGLDPGDYEYVIITNKSWVNAFQPLADWKTKKGIPATIVTTDWIYYNGSYSGSEKEKIRAFIKDAHSSWGSIYFLLGGDTDTIPYHTATYQSQTIPTDTYYSDYDDDWTCEVHVGRASVNKTGSSAGGIATFVNKTLQYEQNPPRTNYAKNISLFGFDLDSTTDGEDCKEDIDDLYIPSNWSITKVYDSHSGNHEDAVDSAVNDGHNLINHIDHCNDHYIGTGYYNHRWGLDNSEVDAFSNGKKQSIWYSIGCWANAFDYDTCIAEHFVRDTDGGGVSFIGNTRNGWYYVGSDDFLSLRYDRYFFRSLFIQNYSKLGIVFSDHKMDAYTSLPKDDYNKYIFTELNLLGDPELPIWTDDPKSFVVTHPNNVTTATTSIKIHVENSGGGNINNSYVCLWKDSDEYLTGYTDTSGDVTLYPTFNTTGMMNVTITKQNYLPYEDDIAVLLDNYPPYAPSNPDPANKSTGILISADLSWTGGDPDGNPVTYDIYYGNSNPPSKVVANHTSTTYFPGTMKYNTTYFWKIIAWDNKSAHNESSLWHFTTEKETNQPPFTPNSPFPMNNSIKVPIHVNLSWIGGDPDGDIVTYDIFFGNSSPPPKIVNNHTNLTYSLGIIDHNTTYYWKIIAWDTQGAFTEGPIWVFTTEEKINQPPTKPTISGTSSGKTGVSYKYKFSSFDIDEDNVFFYINWGDGQKEEWIGPYESTEIVLVNHTWTMTGTFTIRAKARDTFGAESEWGELEVTMPKSKSFTFNIKILDWLFERFPNAFPLLRTVLSM
jgi:hypothetical protein